MASVYSAGDFRNGTTFEMDGNVFRVVEFQHVKPGKGSAFVRTKLKNVISGAVIEKTFNPSEKYPAAQIEKKEMQYLYNDEDLYYFMDNDTYEQIPLNKEQIGDALKFIKENNLSIGRIINCTPSDVGATNFSIEDGTHATALANSVYNAIGRRSTVERRATLHIFAAAPNAFMFFLGQNSVGFGKCILYEYDFEQRNSCTYSQSISFTN